MARRVAMLRSKSDGGVEPRLEREARALARAGYDVHLVMWDRELAYPEEETREGIAIHRVRYRAPYNRPSLLWKSRGWYRRAFRILRRLRPDVVHAADFDTVRPALRARSECGSKFVFDVWDFYADMVTASAPGFLRRSWARRESDAVAAADLVILPDLVRRNRLGVAPRRLVEVMNVPEERSLAGGPHDGFVVFYGGNLARDRGLEDLLAACEATGATLVVAGQGPEEGDLLRRIRASTSARYLGVVSHDEVLRQTAAADVVPALYDPSVANNRWASPNKVFEALMLGKPILASEGTAIADLVTREAVGLAVPYGDRAKLEAALAELKRSPEKRAAMGASGRRLYQERFRWDIMEARLVAAYRDLVGGP